MNWTRVAFGLSNCLSVALVIRLTTLRLHSVYRIFCWFLIFQVLTESLTFVLRFSSLDATIDYRINWLIVSLGTWILSLWIVYALLRAILANLPGILKFSRRVLNVVLLISIAIALVSAGPEYSASGASSQLTPIAFWVSVALLLERVVATVALLTLLLTLLFIFWFPVTVPRNLAVFSLGLSVYFVAKITLLLFHSFWFHANIGMVSNGVNFVLCLCLAYWTALINKRGEFVPVIIGRSWGAISRSDLLASLDSINASLVNAGRRPTSSLR